jgi:pimeloyl-ACP methyl ester carboxylesterase
MSSIATTVASAGTSESTKANKPLVTGYILASLMATDPRGYAQACLAAAKAEDADYSSISCPTLIVAGAEDKTAPKATIEYLQNRIAGSKVETIDVVGHWFMLEDHEQVGAILCDFAVSQSP